jgi:hypothetical protein
MWLAGKYPTNGGFNGKIMELKILGKLSIAIFGR